MAGDVSHRLPPPSKRVYHTSRNFTRARARSCLSAPMYRLTNALDSRIIRGTFQQRHPSRSGEMADTLRSGRSARKGVRVQIPLSAPVERSHSGLVRRFAKPLMGFLIREFESLPLRPFTNPLQERVFWCLSPAHCPVAPASFYPNFRAIFAITAAVQRCFPIALAENRNSRKPMRSGPCAACSSSTF
jgi:hypothetical protein